MGMLAVLTLVAVMVESNLAARLPRQANPGSSVLDLVPLIDGHNDLPWNLRSLEKNQINDFDFNRDLTQDPRWNCTSCFTDLPRLRKGKVGAQFWVAYVPCSSQYKDAVEMTMQQVDVIKRFVDMYPEDMQLVYTADGIGEAFAAGKIGSLIAVEGGHSIDSSLGILRVYQELGVRYLTLTHTCNTPWADASPVDGEGGTPEHNGLTEFGKTVVQELNRLGIMVDLAHVSHQTMIDAINASVAPVIFSHSSAYAICQHHRNVRDDVLKMVTLNGGIVMVNFYSAYLRNDGARGTIEDVVAHINYIRNVAGVDHVGIGSDFDGVSMVPEGVDDVSKYPDIFDRLAQPKDGEPEWSSDDLMKLAGLNLLRVFSKVEQVHLSLTANQPIEDLIPTNEIPNDAKACRTDL
ncbi:dipeptidase 1-like [Schistocerca serialis cubense]|uniref:dipeptidase 1-like n=1 Tax=Schistocerca serialis cubense TaxID=2023355 RepID=UPI00214E9C46|nr:dipeptidase 1-like [Schistocerca serialis cubense]